MVARENTAAALSFYLLLAAILCEKQNLKHFVDFQGNIFYQNKQQRHISCVSCQKLWTWNSATGHQMYLVQNKKIMKNNVDRAIKLWKNDIVRAIELSSMKWDE